MSSRTAAVIVNWNGSSFLQPLLASLDRESAQQIVVVDNASTDDSLQVLAGFPNVQLIANRRNAGFGKAANQGIDRTSAEYLLILNADTELRPGAMEALERFLDDHPEAGVVAPRLVFPDLQPQQSCRSFPTIRGLFLYLSFFDRLLPSRYRRPEDVHASFSEVDQPMGAAMAVRRSALDQAGRFDPDFFLFMEDVDLCERIKKAGWKIYYLPSATVIHHAGGSTRQDWARSQQQFLVSVLRYFHKRSSPWRVAVLKCSLSLALILRAFILFFARRSEESRFWLSQSARIFSI